MALFVNAMNVSLDGYVDHDRFAPDPVLFRHWTGAVRAATGALYGRRICELMRYRETGDPGWGADGHAFAAAWRARPVGVVARTPPDMGPNATLISRDIEAGIARLKDRLEGEVDVCGTVLAQSLAARDLIDEYRLYVHPVVLGGGTPFFAAARPPLRLLGSDRIGPEVVRLTYGRARQDP